MSFEKKTKQECIEEINRLEAMVNTAIKSVSEYSQMMQDKEEEIANLEQEVKRLTFILKEAREANLFLENTPTKATLIRGLLIGTIDPSSAGYMITSLRDAEEAARKSTTPSGNPSWPQGGTDAPLEYVHVRWSVDLPKAQTGEKIPAIKFVRELTNCSLKDGKDFIEGFSRLRMSKLSLEKLKQRYGQNSFDVMA